MLILDRVHWNALQKWIVGRLQVGITCEQNNGRGFRNVKKQKLITKIKKNKIKNTKNK